MREQRFSGAVGPVPGPAWRRWVRPMAWLPLVVLALTAVFLAEVVEPWPEGRILMTLHGLGPHGITVSDVLVLGVIVIVGLGSLRLIGRGR